MPGTSEVVGYQPTIRAMLFVMVLVHVVIGNRPAIAVAQSCTPPGFDDVSGSTSIVDVNSIDEPSGPANSSENGNSDTEGATLDPNELNHRGIECAITGQSLEAMQFFGDAIRMGDAVVRQKATKNRARLALMLNDWDTAIADLRTLTYMYPKDGYFYSRLASCYVKTGQIDLAVEAFEHASSRGDNSPDTFTFKALALHEVGRRKEAEKVATLAIIPPCAVFEPSLLLAP